MSSPQFDSLAPSGPRESTPCTENGETHSMSPASADAEGCLISDRSSSCSYSSRAPTPQCLPLDDQSSEAMEVVSQDMIYQYMEIARSLVEDAQSRAATPCLSLDVSPYTDSEMKLNAFQWPSEPYTIASGLALDELPDSDLCYRPEYQLTEEWLERTLKSLAEIDEEKKVSAEREVDMRAKENAEIETEVVAEPRAV